MPMNHAFPLRDLCLFFPGVVAGGRGRPGDAQRSQLGRAARLIYNLEV
jgi:hypothetical protein